MGSIHVIKSAFLSVKIIVDILTDVGNAVLSTVYVLCSLRLLMLKTEGQKI